MSWRLFFEATTTFGILIPMVIGRYHTCPKALKNILPALSESFKIRDEVYDLLDYMVEHDLNCGFMDIYSGGHLLGNWGPHHDSDYDHILSTCKYEPKRLNLFRQIAWTNFYLAYEYVVLHWKVRGIVPFFWPRFHIRMLKFFMGFIVGNIGSLIHQISNYGRPANSWMFARKQEFKSYKYNPKPNPY